MKLNLNPLSANPTKWSNTLKQFVGNSSANRQYTDKLAMGHLNGNSVRNKFDTLDHIVDNNVDILIIFETNTA